MDRSYHAVNPNLRFSLFRILSLMLLLGLFSLALSAESPLTKLIKSHEISNPEFNQTLAKAEVQQQFLDFARQKYKAVQLHKIFQQKIKKLPAVEKMRAYTRFFDEAKQQHRLTPELLQTLRPRQNSNQLLTLPNGKITGTVLLEGGVAFESIQVMAFDQYGFYAGSGTVSFIDGSYQITDLPTGNYYVLTYSNFVDEFYNNVPSYFLTNWRNATLVSVTDGSTTANIDFDLQRGATISGNIYEQDGVTPIAAAAATFSITYSTSPIELFSRFAFTDGTGAYSFNIPAMGDFKIGVQIFGYQPKYYNNKDSWAAADPVTVHSMTDVIGGIDFSLTPGTTAPPTAGGIIEGMVLNSASQPVGNALIFAFDPADTSIAGIGISQPTNPPTIPGAYEISDLPAGSYILYANDFFGTSAGEYYLDATTPDLATPVPVVVSDTTKNIDFTLPDGGQISGTVKKSDQTAVDSSLVIAIKVDTQNSGKWLGERLDLGFAISDTSGAYQINGLSSGSYILRTVTLFGPDMGTVVDEYYQGVQDIFAFDQATRVTVTAPQPTTNIDFVLDLASFITGHLFETDGVTPVQGTPIIVALDATTLHPALALPLYSPADGSYQVGPLAGGTYILLGVITTPDSLHVRYVPQFYDGVSDPTAATPVVVSTGSFKFGIDFKFQRASTIHGFVNLSPGFPAGADSLHQTVVVVYNAATGAMVGNADISFAGGYKVSGLPPGDYKVQALPAFPGYSGTYSGNATTFDAAGTTTLLGDDTARVDIVLKPGTGSISGTVTDANAADVPGVLAIAYDPTGHVVSAGVSGGDLSQGPPFFGNGQYNIPGLVDGTYYVRTFSLFQVLLLLQNVDLSNLGGPLGFFSGFADPNLLANITQQPQFTLLADEWYDNHPITASTLNIGDLLLRFLFSGDMDNPFLPFVQTIPTIADPIVLSSGNNQIGGIDFQLDPRSGVVTGLPNDGKGNSIPSSFELTQNYPNPFNPSTTIRYKVPQTSKITITIFNILGQKVRTLVDGVVSAGNHQVKWDGRNALGNEVSSGIYLLRMRADNFTQTRRMVLMR